LFSFGEVLRKCIDKNDIKIYQLAQKSGIERTSIQKIMSRGSIPSEENFQSLINALSISSFEKDELLTAYKISKDGEFLYNQRIQVKRLIDRMCEVQQLSTPMKNNFQIKEKADESRRETEVINGELSVNHALESLLSREADFYKNPCVRFIMPHDYNFFYDNLFLKYCKNPALKIECLFEFSKKNEIVKEKRNSNLDVIGALMPFIMKAGGSFTAYYLYSAFPVKYVPTVATPYFLITHDCVTAFTIDLQTAIIFRNAEIIECYNKIFDDMKHKAQPLIGYVESLEDSIMFYGDIEKSGATGISGFGSHPCVAVYYNKEVLEAHIPHGLPSREQMIEVITMLGSGLRKLADKGNTPSFFTLDGFNLFVNKGVIETIMEGFFRTCTPPERAEVIKKMITDTENDSILYRAINTSNIKVPSCFYTDVFPNSHMNIVIGSPVDGKTADISTIKIGESSIVAAFHDFLVNSVDSDLVYSKADTLKVLREALETLTNL
jgi:transcriptional regulator with XRE-family HTH domain